MSIVDKYRSLLLFLWPKGRAWNGEMGTFFFKFNEGAAVELARVEERGYKLLEELDPRTTSEMLTDWERMVGIPDECSGIAATIQERINAVYRKYISRGGNTASNQFKIDLAATLGYTITIVTPGTSVFRMGKSRMGDRLYGINWRFVYQVITPNSVLEVFRMGRNRMGDRLRNFQNAELECIIRRANLSHEVVQFIYLE